MHEHTLQKAAGLFGTGQNDLTLLRGGNFSNVYAFQKDGQSYVLRLTPPNSDIDQASMLSIVHWMQYLSDHNLHVPRPLLSTQAHLVESITADEGTWLASAVEKAPGVLAERLPFEAWNGYRFALLGRATGQMHALSRRYQPTAGISPRPQWDETTNNNNPQEDLNQIEGAILEKRDKLLLQINAVPRTEDSYGLIHGDLQCANFFIDPRDDTITLFDFDDCCYGWYLMDIALPLLDFLVVYPGLQREAFAVQFLDHFLSGYLAENPMKPAELQYLPLFLRLLEIGLYIQVAPFAGECQPDSWVGKFIMRRKESILNAVPFVELNIPAITERIQGNIN